MPGRPHMVLHDLKLFRDLMTGRHDTVTLAREVGRSKQLIAYLRNGTRRSCGQETAHRIEDVLGVSRGALFCPDLSADPDNTPESGASKDLYKPREAGVRMGCSERHVRRLMAAGVLATKDIATPGSKRTKIRVPAASLNAYIARDASDSVPQVRGPRPVQSASR